MDNTVKSGKEILNDFFNKIEDIPNVDKNLALELRTMYQAGKLTITNLSNKLSSLREEEINDKN